MKTHVHASARLTDHVVLISIDGLRPDIYRDEGWPAPVLHELALSGAIALNARSVFPALTYPAHATIVTGALPVHHGIIDNEWMFGAAGLIISTGVPYGQHQIISCN